MSFEEYQSELEMRNEVLPLDGSEQLVFRGKVATYAGAYFAQGLGRKPILRWEGDGFEVHYSSARNQLKAVVGTEAIPVDICQIQEDGQIELSTRH